MSIGKSIYIEEIDESEDIPKADYDFSDVNYPALADKDKPLCLDLASRDFIIPDDFSKTLCEGDCSSTVITFSFQGEADFNMENSLGFVKWRVGAETGFD